MKITAPTSLKGLHRTVNQQIHKIAATIMSGRNINQMLYNSITRDITNYDKIISNLYYALNIFWPNAGPFTASSWERTHDEKCHTLILARAKVLSALPADNKLLLLGPSACKNAAIQLVKVFQDSKNNQELFIDIFEAVLESFMHKIAIPKPHGRLCVHLLDLLGPKTHNVLLYVINHDCFFDLI